jgi:hypothetical protein
MSMAIRQRIAMDISSYLMKSLAGVGRTLAVVIMALVVMIGTAQAQNAATTSSHASMSGVQSVITHARDSLQRNAQAVQLRWQRRHRSTTGPDPH